MKWNLCDKNNQVDFLRRGSSPNFSCFADADDTAKNAAWARENCLQKISINNLDLTCPLKSIFIRKDFNQEGDKNQVQDYDDNDGRGIS